MLWAGEIDVRCGPLGDEAAEDLARALAQEDVQAPVVAEDLRAGTLRARFHVDCDRRAGVAGWKRGPVPCPPRRWAGQPRRNWDCAPAGRARGRGSGRAVATPLSAKIVLAGALLKEREQRACFRARGLRNGSWVSGPSWTGTDRGSVGALQDMAVLGGLGWRGVRILVLLPHLLPFSAERIADCTISPNRPNARLPA